MKFKVTYLRLTMLVLAMATKNILVKRLVLELFSAVCVYSALGHRATLDALDYFKVIRFILRLQQKCKNYYYPIDVKNKTISLRCSDIRNDRGGNGRV